MFNFRLHHSGFNVFDNMLLLLLSLVQGMLYSTHTTTEMADAIVKWILVSVKFYISIQIPLKLS